MAPLRESSLHFWFLCSIVLTILSLCSIIQLVGPCFRVIMEFISWTVTKSFFSHKIAFRKKYWNLDLDWETQTDPQKTLADGTMIAIVDDEELDKRKASRIHE